jgi:hypothetical protein
VRFYWNTGDPEKNLGHVRKYGNINDYMTGVLPCCNIANIPGDGNTSISRNISGVVAGYKKYGLTVHPVASISSIVDTASLAKVKLGIPALVEWVKTIGANGVIIDYEPSKNYTPEHVKNYASFMTSLSEAMHVAKKEASCDLASWGILNKCVLEHCLARCLLLCIR